MPPKLDDNYSIRSGKQAIETQAAIGVEISSKAPATGL